MNGITKQVVVGVCIALISAAVFGVQSLYSDVQRNNIHREDSFNMMSEINSKIDDIKGSQAKIMNEIAVLKNNQTLLIEGKIND